MTRREALLALASTAIAGCTARHPRPIAGRFVGADHARGHLLRDVARRPTIGATERTTVAIIGAGVAGLSAAWALERAGMTDFVILELEDDPGGTARAGESRVSRFPWGAHYVVAPPIDNHPLVALLAEVGAIESWAADGQPRWAEGVVCREPRERVYFRGEWHDGLYPRIAASPRDLAELAAFEDDMRRWASWRDPRGRRAFTAPRSRASDDPAVHALDRGSMADYIRDKGWQSERLRWLIDYSCRDDYGLPSTRTSAWAGIHYFASRLDGDEGDSAPILTWPEGNGRLVAHLADVAGSRLRTGALVTDVAPGDRHVAVTWFDPATSETRALRADRVVFALPRFLARHVIAPYRATPPDHLTASVYGSWLVANLTLSDRPRSHGVGLAWDNVLYDSPSLGYVTATHQLGRDHGPTVLTYYLPLLDDDAAAGRERLLATPWEQQVAAILSELGPSHPRLRELVERVDIYRWGHAMVRPTPGFMHSEALAASARPLGRVHFAHTDLSGMALFEEAHDHGMRAADEVLCELGIRTRA